MHAAEAALKAAQSEAASAASAGEEAVRARAESTAGHKEALDKALAQAEEAKAKAAKAAEEATKWEAEAKACMESQKTLETQLASALEKASASGESGDGDAGGENLKKAKKDMAKKIYGMVQDTFVDGEDFAGKKVRKTFKGWLKKLI